MTDFSTLNLCPALKLNLARNGFVTPTPVQAQSIPPALEGRDVVATAQTGTGKTLAFALPIVDALAKVKPSTSKAAAIKAVILSPTRELAIQINEAIDLLTAGTQVRSASVVGGMNEANQLKAIRRGAQIVVATPGRLCDFLDRRLVDLSGVTTVVLDEADRMLDMGFLPSIREILDSLPS
jgi:ATP-dependent RNA helicase RhlE